MENFYSKMPKITYIVKCENVKICDFQKMYILRPESLQKKIFYSGI